MGTGILNHRCYNVFVANVIVIPYCFSVYVSMKIRVPNFIVVRSSALRACEVCQLVIGSKAGYRMLATRSIVHWHQNKKLYVCEFLSLSGMNLWLLKMSYCPDRYKSK